MFWDDTNKTRNAQEIKNFDCTTTKDNMVTASDIPIPNETNKIYVHSVTFNTIRGNNIKALSPLLRAALENIQWENETTQWNLRATAVKWSRRTSHDEERQ